MAEEAVEAQGDVRWQGLHGLGLVMWGGIIRAIRRQRGMRPGLRACSGRVAWLGWYVMLAVEEYVELSEGCEWNWRVPKNSGCRLPVAVRLHRRARFLE